MKSYIILFIVVVFMHTITLVNVTIFNGEWNGIVLFLSNTLFIIAVFYFGIEFRANRKKSRST
ncbi:hypothetical protein [Halalkalibacter akibai]|uniref:Uncharacterized protein n=1 Tax=Halalkalibacter akibai (strain ATCC 43226 / DSM 21942 / CIP 109018 / JCM 9157 / 1139) TaxID=1236973 RepID=W4QPT2_HALA3|nr:hypothetical protein [Halalkalibacter akibai]GAE33673.1 hypothetical protein JCM9157_694 [Halalkalibacter akibai JCM 9157]